MTSKIEQRLTELCDAGSYFIMPPRKKWHTGDPGRYIESLFDVPENNRDTPDLVTGEEIKWHGGSSTPVTLLSFEPNDSPDSLKQLIASKGYIDTKGRLAFWHKVHGCTPTTGKRVSGFFVRADRKLIRLGQDQVYLNWYSDEVLNAIVAKLRRVFLVQGWRDGNKLYPRKVTRFEDIRVSDILPMVNDGTICYDIGACFRTSQPIGALADNPGCKLRATVRNLPKLYRKHHVVCDHS